MIESPTCLTEQLLNLSERIAIEMRVLLNTVLNMQAKVDNIHWDTLGSLAFEDTVASTKVEKLNYDPVEFFDSVYNRS